MSTTLQMTSADFWISALVAAAIDAGLIFFILRRIPPSRFLRMRIPLIASAGVFWGVLGIWIVRWGWSAYYRFFYPEWMGRWGIILFAPALGVGLAALFFWIASFFRRQPIPIFLILVGVQALLEHLIIGIFAFHILAIPAFSGVNPLSLLVFSVPEYILYWSVIILIASFLQALADCTFRPPA